MARQRPHTTKLRLHKQGVIYQKPPHSPSPSPLSSAIRYLYLASVAIPQFFYGIFIYYFHLSSKFIRFTLATILLTIILSNLPLLSLSSTSFTNHLFTQTIQLWDLPDPTSLESHTPALTTKIYDRNGQLLYKLYKDQNRSLTHLSILPEHTKNAFIAIEDKDFYTHHGISYSGILRAITKNINFYLCQYTKKSCNLSFQGGSTITQQLVKNIYFTPERTFTRKIKELILSLQIERLYTKDQILELYLNEVNFGGSIYGLEEAAQNFFSKPASELNLSESALLAGLPAAPTTYSPFGSNPQFALQRQRQVLEEMLTLEFINFEQFTQSLETPLEISPPKSQLLAPHFVMYTKEHLVNQFGESLVNQGGLQVTTTLDLSLQQTIESLLRSEIDKLAKFKITNGAVLVTNPQTGEILAMVGSRDYFDMSHDGNVNLTTALRQPGSSIKPLLYSLALENGITPSTIIPDTPITINLPGQPPYTPKNYDNRYHGNVTVRTALASSYNIPAIKLVQTLGLKNFINHAEEMGITTWSDRSRFGPSLALGAGEVKLTDMAVAYGIFANKGKKTNLLPLLYVTNTQNQPLYQTNCNHSLFASLINATPTAPISPSANCNYSNVLSPEISFLISNILSDNNARAPSFGLHSQLVIPGHQVAVKTGTSNNLRDNWTIGYTSDYLVAVWVGNNNNSPMSHVASGVTGASPIWQKVMFHLLKDLPSHSFTPPPGITSQLICTPQSTVSCPNCIHKRLEYFLSTNTPPSNCNTKTPDITTSNQNN